MIGNISIKEYNKLKLDVTYWKKRALKKERSRNFYETLYKEEKSWHKFYKEEHGKRVSEYMYLKQKYDELKEQKKQVTFVSFGEVKDLNKAKKLAEKVRKLINDEHQCNRNCFEKHVLPAIQKDYNHKVLDFILDRDKRGSFLKYWNKKLKSEYNFIENLYMIADTIMVKYK